MFMDKWVLAYVFLLFFFQWIYKHIKACYQFQYEVIKIDKNNPAKNNIMFFRLSDETDLEFELFLEHQYASTEPEISKRKQWNKKIKNKIEKFTKKYSWKDISTIFFYIILPYIIWGITYIPKLTPFCEKLFEKLRDNNVDIYLAQLSMTFITISVMSIFSDGNLIIYWQNVVKKMLIEPVGRCFKAYFVYSFTYLFFSTVFFLIGNYRGLAIMFLFNIVCLFDLSRIMINCYYGEKTKQEKLIKEFTKKIERANEKLLEQQREYQQWKKLEPSEKNKKKNEFKKGYLDEIINTFDTFNYYTGEAYKCEKYFVLKDNLEAYGKLLAHIKFVKIDNLPVLEWYGEKTYKYYRNVVKNYYKEDFSLILKGNKNRISFADNDNIANKIIQDIICRLVNDSQERQDIDCCYELLLYRLLDQIYLVAGTVDAINLDKYKIGIDDCYDCNDIYMLKKYIGEKMGYLLNFYKENVNTQIGDFLSKDKNEMKRLRENFNRVFYQEKLNNSVEEFFSDIVLLNTTNLSGLCFSWMPLKQMDNIKNIIDSVEKNVRKKIETLPDEKQLVFKKRLDYLRKSVELTLKEK